LNRSSELLCGASAIWIERQTDGSFKILLKTRFGLTAVEAHTVIIAVGAYERHLPFPGWTSRCVLSMGAAQMLLRSDCLNSIKRAVLSGTGPLLWKVASEMCDNGIKVMVVSFASLSHCLKQFQALATCPRELIEAIACLLSIVRHSARVLFRHAVVFVNAKNDVEVFVAPVDEVGAPNISESISHRCDLVAIGHGLLPNLLLTRAIMCAHRYDEHLKSWLPICTELLETSVEGLFVAGEVASVGGFRKAVTEGRIAAYAALHRIGIIKEGELKKRCSKLLAINSKLVRVARRLNATPGMDGWWRWLPNDTVLCRCEDVTAGEVRQGVQWLVCDCDDMNLLKFVTRIGMGYCQGRTCENAIEAFIKLQHRTSSKTIVPLNIRFPIEPIRFEEIAVCTEA
ncbi:MAG: NAD(P)/FAD-dependent oxidoreductase, partial [Armatimonadetes bacterium]|nr:NAD(P)/FAD-dependent oxidoreductase [Armatimonadota bacterium]